MTSNRANLLVDECPPDIMVRNGGLCTVCNMCEQQTLIYLVSIELFRYSVMFFLSCFTRCGRIEYNKKTFSYVVRDDCITTQNRKFLSILLLHNICINPGFSLLKNIYNQAFNKTIFGENTFENKDIAFFLKNNKPRLVDTKINIENKQCNSIALAGSTQHFFLNDDEANTGY